MNVTINEGTTFIISDEIGDIVPGKEDGLYDQDTRFLSRYEMFIDGVKPIVLSGRQVNYYSAVHYLTNPKTDDVPPDLINIARKRFVGDGLHEDLDITSYSLEPVEFKMRLEFDTDFAEIFDVKAGQIPARMPAEFSIDQEASSISFKYESKDVYRETRIIFGAPVDFDPKNKAVILALRLQPRQRWHACINFLTLVTPKVVRPKYSCESFDIASGRRSEFRESWILNASKLFTDYDTLQHAYEQSLLDMAALRLKGPKISKVGVIPAAGIPWYYTCFGRDSLITAYQTMPYLPIMTYGVLRNLATYQGSEVNPATEEEPGKILHEIRWSGITPAGKTPYDIYYGTVDATPLFIIVMSELYKWTADKAFIEELKDNLLGALEWMDTYGDKDKDGYVEYKRMSDKGLANQGWKDSWDCIRFADGGFPEAPIALCEVQGYVYKAKLGAADLLDALGDSRRATRLREEAVQLKKAFNQDFWMDHIGYFAQALDKDKHQVDSITSNAGQLLWSGIVEKDKAAVLRDRLLSQDMFTGWGIRTMSYQMAAYNAISYHNGSVWPHDNAIIAAGLMDYGFHRDALNVIDSILDAGQYFAYQRLPELFCGFERSSSKVPIDYPAASSPQAWASGASMLMLTSILGMKADAEKKILSLNPKFPADIYRIYLAGVRIGTSYLSFEVLFERGEMQVNVTENPGSYKINLVGRQKKREGGYRKTGTEG